MSNRKNSFDIKDRCNSRDSRSWSIGSIGSIESIKMDDEEPEKKPEKKPTIKRRVREMNIGDHNRRNSPNPIYWKLLMDFLKKTE
jgi:hypothetical protein